MNSGRLWRLCNSGADASRGGAVRIAVTIVAPFALCVSIAGCPTAQLNKHANALSVSLAPVVDQSAAAYEDAVAVHQLREGYEAALAYENKDASYNPRNLPVFLPEKEIQARLAVLAALEVYSNSLIEITQSSDSPDLDAAAKSAGGALTSVGNDLAPSIENILGIQASESSITTTTVSTVSASGSTTTTTSSAAPLLSPQVRNGLSTAVDALGQYLVSRKVASELPAKIEAMDPTIQLFCRTLANDVSALDDIEQRDYDRILNLEKQFLLEDAQPGKNVDPEAWRAEAMKLPEIARKQKEAHEQLIALREALNNLALTHHALAAEAQHNNPEELKDKMNDLANAGSALGNFYSSLPTK